MALLWIEGFEGFGTSAGSTPSPTGVVARKYSLIAFESTMDTEAGRFSGYSLEANSNGTYIRAEALTTDDTLTVGVAVRFLTIFDTKFLTFYDGAQAGMNVRITSAGEIAVYRNNTLLNTTSGLGLNQTTWYYIEFQVVCHDSTGSYEVRVAQVNVLSASGVVTKEGSNNYHSTFLLGKSGAATPQFDDFYCLDSSGSDNNDFLGNCKVVRIDPDGDDTANWTTSTPSGNHFENVDETILDDDTSYVEEPTVNVTDLYDYGSVPNLGTIYGLQVNTECRETDATTFSLIMPIESGGSQYDDSSQIVGTSSYTTMIRVTDNDPDTGNLWTEGGINAAKFGVKVG